MTMVREQLSAECQYVYVPGWQAEVGTFHYAINPNAFATAGRSFLYNF